MIEYNFAITPETRARLNEIIGDRSDRTDIFNQVMHDLKLECLEDFKSETIMFQTSVYAELIDTSINFELIRFMVRIDGEGDSKKTTYSFTFKCTS